MPIIKSAIKRVKQANVRRERNVATKRDIKVAMKAFQAKPTSETLSKVHSELDKALKKNLLHKNTVARRKAAISQMAKDAGVKLSAAKKPSASTTARTATSTKKTASKTAAKTPAKPGVKKPSTTTAKAKAPAKKPATTKKAAPKK